MACSTVAPPPGKIGELVAGEKRLLQFVVRLQGVRCDDQVDHLLQRHLVQGRGDVAELLLLGPDAAKLELGLHCCEPGDRCISPKQWQLQVSHVGGLRGWQRVLWRFRREETAR